MSMIIYSFLIGFITCWIIDILTHIKQKKVNEIKERENFLVLYRELKTPKTRISVEDITKTEIELTIEFKNLQKKITKALNKSDIDKAILLADKYLKVANTIAKKKENKINSEDIQIENLTIKELLKLHSSLFPENYELAGKIRKVRVWIEGEKPKEPRLLPPPSDKVLYLLKNILFWWENKSKEIQNSTKEEKIKAIAQFHHQFVVIHPFLDGNGRIARLLLELQLKELFGRNIKLEISKNKKEYYKALSDADKKDMTQLINLITNLVDKKSNSRTSNNYFHSLNNNL